MRDPIGSTVTFVTVKPVDALTLTVPIVTLRNSIVGVASPFRLIPCTPKPMFDCDARIIGGCTKSISGPVTAPPGLTKNSLPNVGKLELVTEPSTFNTCMIRGPTSAFAPIVTSAVIRFSLTVWTFSIVKFVSALGPTGVGRSIFSCVIPVKLTPFSLNWNVWPGEASPGSG